MKDSTTPESDLREFVDSRSTTLKLDRDGGVLRGVKILGMESANGRSYLPEAVQTAAGLYEGKRVNVDHGKNGDSRSYRDRMGRLQNVAYRPGDGLYGDLHVNPQHVLAEQLFWDAEKAPENVGLSHDISGTLGRRGGKVVVEAINMVRSVDLVADPATTSGLFEEVEAQTDKEPNMATDIKEVTLKEVTLSQLTADRPELLEEFRKTLADAEGVKAKDEQIGKLTEELKTLKDVAVKAELRASIVEDLQAAGLDQTNKTACSKLFLEGLEAEPDATKRKAIITERATLIKQAGKAGKPISESTHTGEGDLPGTTNAQLVSSWR